VSEGRDTYTRASLSPEQLQVGPFDHPAGNGQVQGSDAMFSPQLRVNHQVQTPLSSHQQSALGKPGTSPPVAKTPRRTGAAADAGVDGPRPGGREREEWSSFHLSPDKRMERSPPGGLDDHIFNSAERALNVAHEVRAERRRHGQVSSNLDKPSADHDRKAGRRRRAAEKERQRLAASSSPPVLADTAAARLRNAHGVPSLSLAAWGTQLSPPTLTTSFNA